MFKKHTHIQVPIFMEHICEQELVLSAPTASQTLALTCQPLNIHIHQNIAD